MYVLYLVQGIICMFYTGTMCCMYVLYRYNVLYVCFIPVQCVVCMRYIPLRTVALYKLCNSAKENP